jgi:hypothetical protein
MEKFKWTWDFTPSRKGMIIDGDGFIVVSLLTRKEAQEIVRQHNIMIEEATHESAR